jgi:hypothetical protein
MPRNPTPASVPKDLLAVLAERYGMHAPLSARRLTGGYANDVFLLDALLVQDGSVTTLLD